MGKRAWGAGLAILLSAASCKQPPLIPLPPPVCEPISPLQAGLDDEVVWGIADLHAHPGIEEGFNGSLIWGKAIDDLAPVNAAELPRIEACPVETHLPIAKGPIDRAVGQQVFPEVAAIAKYAHAPVATSGQRPTSAWPNARDVVHQQMQVASIRRAYEGGLRLMFASTADDQVVAALLTGPNLVDGFVPRIEADHLSAGRQLDKIEEIVARNPTWMGIARTPAEARCLIRSGRLALVLSVEMDGFDKAGKDLEALQSRGVRHVFPIHLVDNSIGGSAANSSLFNSASAAVSELYREDEKRMQFMDVITSPDYSRSLDRPKALVTADPPVYVDLADIPYHWYSGLCYEPLAACSRVIAEPRSSWLEHGTQNLKGLCTTAEECAAGARPGAARILGMMDAGLLIDVTHMSALAAAETIAIDAGFPYPLIASHGDVAHLCRGLGADSGCVPDLEPPTERNLDAEVARELVRRKGVLGLGTGLGVYDSRAVLSASGVPLLVFDPGQGITAGCAAVPGLEGTSDCEPTRAVELADAGTPIDSIQLDTVEGISGNQGNAQPFVRVELRDSVAAEQFQRRIVLTPAQCSNTGCTASVKLGTRSGLTAPRLACDPLDPVPPAPSQPYTIDDLESVTLQWLYLECGADCQAASGTRNGPKLAERQCAETWNDPQAPHWTISQLGLTAGYQGQTVAPLASFGRRVALPRVTLDRSRGSFPIYARAERPSVRASVPASGHLLRVSVTAGGDNPLYGASVQQVGANVCVAVRQRAGSACPATKPPPPGTRECPREDGWVPINQRGEWKNGLLLYTFVRHPGSESSVCGVDLTILDWDPTSSPFRVDSIQVEAIEDPVGHWVRRYAELGKFVAEKRMGAIALGTDFNGLNGVTDISEFPMPAGAIAASACPASRPPAGDSCPPTAAASSGPGLPLSPMRFRNQDGTLGGEVLIEERGVATYGQLADFLAVVAAYPGCGKDVHDSLMLSAEATLRAWEAIVEPGGHPGRKELPRTNFECGPVPGVGP